VRQTRRTVAEGRKVDRDGRVAAGRDALARPHDAVPADGRGRQLEPGAALGGARLAVVEPVRARPDGPVRGRRDARAALGEALCKGDDPVVAARDVGCVEAVVATRSADAAAFERRRTVASVAVVGCDDGGARGRAASRGAQSTVVAPRVVEQLVPRIAVGRARLAVPQDAVAVAGAYVRNRGWRRARRGDARRGGEATVRTAGQLPMQAESGAAGRCARLARKQRLGTRAAIRMVGQDDRAHRR